MLPWRMVQVWRLRARVQALQTPEIACFASLGFKPSSVRPSSVPGIVAIFRRFSVNTCAVQTALPRARLLSCRGRLASRLGRLVRYSLLPLARCPMATPGVWSAYPLGRYPTLASPVGGLSCIGGRPLTTSPVPALPVARRPSATGAR